MMQNFTQKYTIVQFFEDTKEGYEYCPDNWPLHSTVVDTFAVNWSIDELIIQLSQCLRTQSVVNTIAEGDRYFGENGQVQVVQLSRSEQLIDLHQSILTALEVGGLKLNDPQFARDGFLPHSTVQRHGRLGRGDEVQFKALSIIDMFPDKDPYKRRVVKTITIGG